MIMDKKYKYPRTFHVPWSEGATSDDKTLSNMNHFHRKEVVVTLKMDGEGTTIAKEYMHARSLDSAHHPSRNWVKGLWGAIGYKIPEDWRICGENMYARHSIAYDNLKSYFYVFSIWDDDNECVSWDSTDIILARLGKYNNKRIPLVPVLWRGIYDEEAIRAIPLDLEKDEGYVIRTTESFHYDDFNAHVAKFVRKGHVAENDGHWMTKKVVPNKLKK